MERQLAQQYIKRIRSEIAPATGCTEPAAVALCAAAAAAQLGQIPQTLKIEVSDYIFKNAMNVGIPGVTEVGLDIAGAMGAVCGQPEKGLSVLENLTASQQQKSRELAGNTTISIVNGGPKVYIHATVSAGQTSAEAFIEQYHTNIVQLCKDGQVIWKKEDGEQMPQQTNASQQVTENAPLTVRSIWDFIQSVDVDELYFLRELVSLNKAIAQEGLSHSYGLQVGLRLHQNAGIGLIQEDLANYAVAVTAAAADARMAGCEKAVMSVAGSGNQGLTATLPVIAAAQKANKSEEVLLKSLALSILVTIHAKEYIGRLSVLCGCGVASAIGVTAAIVYMFGGQLSQAEMGIQTMAADISGMVCDGAKPGCALKIATSVSAAMRAATLALSGIGATSHDGIVDQDVEHTLANLGELVLKGMADTNSTILQMLLHKASAAQ